MIIWDCRGYYHHQVSDANKGFVVDSSGTINSLVEGLMLDTDTNNPRSRQKGAVELQETCALALENLALSPIGVAPLRNHDGAMAALRQLRTAGQTEKSRRCAEGALFELEEQEDRCNMTPQAPTATDTGYVMLSYNWDHQSTIKRVNTSLVRRGYKVWIDIEMMQGSTVEVMAAAVEDAAVMCYGISQAYKESANCRLEAQYAYQQQKEMIPLMLEEGYHANGWLGMLLGVRMWYAFCGSVLGSEAAFEGKMEELCREIGDRGRVPVRDDGPEHGGDADGGCALSSLLLNDGEGARTSALQECLVSATVALHSVGRKKSKALMLRTDALLDQLAEDEGGEKAAAWVCAEWSSEHAEAVAEAMDEVRMMEGGSSSVSMLTVSSRVMALLEALEMVVASHVDTADALRAALCGGGDASAVVSVLEHGLEVLEALSMSSPRKQRKPVRLVCERVEGLLEDNLDDVLAQLSMCGASSELETLIQSLCDVSVLCVGEAGAECVETVGMALDELARCLG